MTNWIRLGAAAASLALLAAACGTDATPAATATETSPTPSTAVSTTTTSGEQIAADCPSHTFLDVSSFEGPGGDYPDPVLEVSCDGSTMTVRSNDIPHYAFVPITPNELTAQDHSYTIPLDPVYSDQVIAAAQLGAIAVAVNGGQIVGPSEGPIPTDQAFGDPVHNGILDDCLGHVGMSYHFHALLESCLTTDADATGASPVLGWAPDGFAIHGGRGCLDDACSEVVTFVSGYQRVGDPTTNAADAYEYVASDDPLVLDECNGRIGPDGVYRYHATETYPYIIGCYHGEVTGSLPTDGPPGR